MYVQFSQHLVGVRLDPVHERIHIQLDENLLAEVEEFHAAFLEEDPARFAEEVFGGLTGLKGVHCCGNTDWSLLLETSVDIISFDAYNYADNFVLYANNIRAFVDRGGLLAWGLIPTTAEDLIRETVEALVARFEAAMGELVARGIDRDVLLESALVTPACGLGTLPPTVAERALMLVQGVSDQLRAEYTLA